MTVEYTKIKEDIKIVQISACSNDSDGLTIAGLGSDQQIYSWHYILGSWVIHKK